MKVVRNIPIIALVLSLMGMGLTACAAEDQSSEDNAAENNAAGNGGDITWGNPGQEQPTGDGTKNPGNNTNNPGNNTNNPGNNTNNPGNSTPAGNEGQCQKDGEICLTLGIPSNFTGTPERISISFFNSLPPMGPPALIGTEIAKPTLTPGSNFSIKMENITGKGDYFLYAAIYMPGGGEWMPAPGIDWTGQSQSKIKLTGAAVNIPGIIAVTKVPGEGDNTGNTNPGNGNNPGNNTGNTNPGNTDPGPASGAVPVFKKVTLFDNIQGAGWLHGEDLNGDGFNELLLSTLSEGIDFSSMPPLANGGAYILSRNGGKPMAGQGLGKWSAKKAFDKNAGFGFPNRSSIFDINNDGTDDWVIAGGFLAKPNGFIIWMKGQDNNGTLTFGAPQKLNIPDGNRWYHEVHPIDMDGDGDLDFVTTNNNTKIKSAGGLAYGTSKLEWFENLGEKGKASYMPHEIGQSGGALLTLFDLDDDGDQDIVLPQFFGGDSIVWMENPGDPMGNWEQHLINNTTGKGFGVEIVDLDNDGKMELVYGNHNHQASTKAEEQVMGLYWWDIPEASKIDSLENWDSNMNVIYEGFYINSNKPEQDGAPGVIHTGDVDGDGDLDVTASGDGDKSIYLFVQQEGGVFDKVVLDQGVTMSGDHVMMDLDGDGDMDFVWCIFGESGFTGVKSYVNAYIQDGKIEPTKTPGNNTGTNPGNTPANSEDLSKAGTFPVKADSSIVEYKTATSTDKIPVNIYMPEGVGPFPVVVFLDGFSLGADSYVSYGKHLASWGIIGVVADMPANIFSGKNHVDVFNFTTAVADWIETEGPNPLSKFAGKVDVAKMGIAGHSLGGKISVMFAANDPRAKAVFAIDPVDSGPQFVPITPETYPSVTPELMGQLKVPAVFIGEVTNGTSSNPFSPACAPSEDNFQQYYAAATSPALEIEFVGASHFSFLDNPSCAFICSTCPTGTDNPSVTRAMTQKYMIAFFKRIFSKDASYANWLNGASMTADVTTGLVKAQWKNGF